MLAREAFHDRRQERLGVVVRNAETDTPGQPLLADLHQGRGLDAQHLAGEVDQLVAVIGEPDAAPLLDEELAA